MFTKKQQQALDKLKNYLSSKPAEEIKAEMQEISGANFSVPTIDEYFMNFHKSFEFVESEANLPLKLDDSIQ